MGASCSARRQRAAARQERSHTARNKTQRGVLETVGMNLRIAFRFVALVRSHAAAEIAGRNGRGAANNFLTLASELPKPWGLSIPSVGMRPASRPFACVSPRCGRRSPRPPSSYGDSGFIDACFAGLCLPDLRPLSLAARRIEPQTACKTKRPPGSDAGAAGSLHRSRSAPPEFLEPRKKPQGCASERKDSVAGKTQRPCLGGAELRPYKRNAKDKETKRDYNAEAITSPDRSGASARWRCSSLRRRRAACSRSASPRRPLDPRNAYCGGRCRARR